VNIDASLLVDAAGHTGCVRACVRAVLLRYASGRL